jgi:hypothetical protein
VQDWLVEIQRGKWFPGRERARLHQFIAGSLFPSSRHDRLARRGAIIPARFSTRPHRRGVPALTPKKQFLRLLARIASVWSIAILAGTVLLPDQIQPDSNKPISTDRPAITASSVVVPKGSFQAENGFLITNNQGQRSFDAPETTMRFGVASNTELRFSVPDYYRNLVSGTGIGSGFGDLTIGMKQQLSPATGGFDVSVVAFVSIPTGANAVSSHGYDPGLQLPWSRKLSANWSTAGQFALYWPTQFDKRSLTGESTFLLDRQLTKPLDAFIEYAGDFPQRGGPRHLLHLGAAYRIASRHQFDIHLGIGLSSAAIDHFIGIGYSFRFQALRR